MPPKKIYIIDQQNSVQGQVAMKEAQGPSFQAATTRDDAVLTGGMVLTYFRPTPLNGRVLRPLPHISLSQGGRCHIAHAFLLLGLQLAAVMPTGCQRRTIQALGKAVRGKAEESRSSIEDSHFLLMHIEQHRHQYRPLEYVVREPFKGHPGPGDEHPERHI